MTQSNLLRYFEEELAYLASAGPRFARLHPERAALVSLDNVTSRDPDVERLIQAFAFLAGQVRAELHNELPEITHSLIQLLWPDYLRPIPSTCIVEFKPDLAQIQKPFVLAAGKSYVESTPVSSPDTGHHFACRFRTGYPVAIFPIKLVGVDTIRQPMRTELILTLETGAAADTQIDWSRLRLHIAGDPLVALDIRYWLLEKVVEDAIVAEIKSPEGAVVGREKLDRFEPVGMMPEESLLDSARLTFPGYRLVQEYFLCRHKFQFVDMVGLSRTVPIPAGHRVVVRIPLKEAPPDRLRLSLDTFKLHCSPVINLFPSAAVPIRYDGRRGEHPILAEHDSQAFAIHRVTRVYGQVTGGGQIVDYPNFLDFRHAPAPGEPYYHLSVASGVDQRPAWSLSLHRPGGIVPPQVVSVDLVCTNGSIAAALLPGDIRFRGEGVPDVMEVRSLTQPEPLHQPPIDSAGPWRFISHLAFNYLSLEDADGLAGVLRLYDWSKSPANIRRIQGLRSLKGEPGCTIVEGIPLRGRDLSMELDTAHFANVGDAYLFSEVLSHFLALYSNTNSYTRLAARLLPGPTFRWPALNGRQKPI